MKRAVIFDLDGTICNTLEDLALCTNDALAQLGLPGHPVEVYRYIVGNGVEKQMQRALTEAHYTPERAARLKVLFKEAYARRWMEHTRPYDGMLPALEELRQQGYLLGVCTNKPDEFAQEMVRHCFGSLFSLICGNRPGIPVKPDPTLLRQMLDTLGVPPEGCLYCGDSCVDMQTARAAGVCSVGVLWGFRPQKELEENGAVFLAQTPSELPELARRFAEGDIPKFSTCADGAFSTRPGEGRL